MPRVVITKNSDEIKEAPSVCPVQAFKKGPKGELVIDPSICIDCGVCQTTSPEGAIMPDDEAPKEAIEYNAKQAKEWKPAI